MKSIKTVGFFLFVLLFGVFVPSNARAQSVISCDLCLAGAYLIEELIESKTAESEIEKIAVDFCTLAHVPTIDKNVCQGIIATFAPEVIPIFVGGGLNPDEVCKLLGLCSASSPAKKLNIALPPKPEVKKTKMKLVDHKTGEDGSFVRVAHVTDLHYDELYLEGANANCNEPLCCRFVEPNATRLAQKWGDYNCDLSPAMLSNFLSELAASKPDFVVWTGDTTAHDVWGETLEIQIKRLKAQSKALANALGNIPVYPIMGNHDTWPVDQFSRKPKDIAHVDDFEWLLTGLSEVWGAWLDENALKTFQIAGYYSVLAKPGLRVIGLNTAWGDNLNFYLLLVAENQTVGQYEWLVNELTNAEANNEKVMILGHIYPAAATPVWADTYFSIVSRFADIIVGQFYGHSHQDHFQLFRNGNETLATLFIAPSVTTFTNYNPRFRIYNYSSDFELLDYTQYFANITLANVQGTPSWEEDYSALAEFKLEDLSPTSWFKLTERFKTDDALFQKWRNIHYGQSTAPCISTCKKRQICALQTVTPEQFNSCVSQ